MLSTMSASARLARGKTDTKRKTWAERAAMVAKGAAKGYDEQTRAEKKNKRNPEARHAMEKAERGMRDSHRDDPRWLPGNDRRK